MADFPSRRLGVRSGFTLVEMLVVIAIIGTLVSFGAYGAWRALIYTKERAVMTEMQLLCNAMEALRESRGGYPPSMHAFAYNATGVQHGGSNNPKAPPVGSSYISRDNYLQAFTRRAFNNYGPSSATLRAMSNSTEQVPYYRFTSQYTPFHLTLAQSGSAGSDSVGTTLDMETMDAAEALVFWLGGFPTPYKNGQYIAPKKLCGFSKHPVNPYLIVPFPNANLSVDDWMERRTPPLFDFDESRLVDYDNDGWWEYIPEAFDPSDPPPPYVYFDSDLYASWINPTMGPNMTAYPPPKDMIPTNNGFSRPDWGTAVPMVRTVASTTGPISWIKPSEYQIICAGSDHKYSGPYTQYTPPSGTTTPNPSNVRLRVYQAPSAATTGLASYPYVELLDDAGRDNMSNFTDQKWADDLGY